MIGRCKRCANWSPGADGMCRCSERGPINSWFSRLHHECFVPKEERR